MSSLKAYKSDMFSKVKKVHCGTIRVGFVAELYCKDYYNLLWNHMNRRAWINRVELLKIITGTRVCSSVNKAIN